MSEAIINEPGTPRGPCPKSCKHTLCSGLRNIAKSECVSCDEPIGYEHGFTTTKEPKQYVHTKCLKENIENSDSDKKE